LRVAKTIDYYFSPVSPWTYLGHERFREIARKHGATITVKPVDYGRIFPVSGGLPVAKRPPQRQAYRLVELERWRKHLGVPVNVQPKFFPYDARLAALVTIAQVRPIKISFTLPQSDLPRIQARQQTQPLLATLDVRDRAGHILAAPVDFTSNIVSNQSGTIELRATFANTDLSLVPGQLVNVTVQLNDIPRALVVPRDAVNDSPGGSFVFVVRNGKAAQTPVEVLTDDGTDAAIAEIREAVADKGYSKNETLAELEFTEGLRTYIAEPQHTQRRNWRDKPAEHRQAVTNNRRRVRGQRGRAPAAAGLAAFLSSSCEMQIKTGCFSLSTRLRNASVSSLGVSPPP